MKKSNDVKYNRDHNSIISPVAQLFARLKEDDPPPERSAQDDVEATKQDKLQALISRTSSHRVVLSGPTIEAELVKKLSPKHTVSYPDGLGVKNKKLKSGSLMRFAMVLEDGTGILAHAYIPQDEGVDGNRNFSLRGVLEMQERIGNIALTNSPEELLWETVALYEQEMGGKEWFEGDELFIYDTLNMLAREYGVSYVANNNAESES